MNGAVRDCLVQGYEPLVDAVKCPTRTIGMFSRRRCAGVVYGAVQRIADARHRPPVSVEDVVSALERCGLPRAAALLRAM